MLELAGNYQAAISQVEVLLRSFTSEPQMELLGVHGTGWLLKDAGKAEDQRACLDKAVKIQGCEVFFRMLSIIF